MVLAKGNLFCVINRFCLKYIQLIYLGELYSFPLCLKREICFVNITITNLFVRIYLLLSALLYNTHVF